MLSKEECQGMQLATLNDVSTAWGCHPTPYLDQDCKGTSAKGRLPSDLLSTSPLVLLVLSSLADTAHSLFLHIDNTIFC